MVIYGANDAGFSGLHCMICVDFGEGIIAVVENLTSSSTGQFRTEIAG